ncbi:MAG: hypothetical protein WBE60_06390 [Nitrosotalea sp.]
MKSRMRTDFATAVEKTLETLKSGESFTQNKLAQKTRLNFRTLQKVLDHIGEVQSILQENIVDISALGNVKIVRMKERAGLTSFPENIQKMIIKTLHYPTASREEEILVYFLIRKAISKDSAIDIPQDSMLRELMESEYVGKTKSGYYLTSDGMMVAKGALKLYPELKEVNRVDHFSRRSNME